MLDPGSPWFGAALVVVLLAASAFFSSSEVAFFSLPSSFVSPTANPDGRAMDRLRADPHRLLVTLLVGNNLVNVALAAVVTLGVARVLPPGEAAVVATLVATTVVLVFGEILPKAYGLGHAERWALTAARPLVAVQAALFPVVAVFDAVTRRLARLIGGEEDIEAPYVE